MSNVWHSIRIINRCRNVKIFFHKNKKVSEILRIFGDFSSFFKIKTPKRLDKIFFATRKQKSNNCTIFEKNKAIPTFHFNIVTIKKFFDIVLVFDDKITNIHKLCMLLQIGNLHRKFHQKSKFRLNPSVVLQKHINRLVSMNHRS